MRRAIVGLALGLALWVVGGGVAQEVAGGAPSPVEATQSTSSLMGGGADLTFFELLLKGGPLMYPLCLCSIIMVAFSIERAASLRRGKILPPITVRRLREATAASGNLNVGQLRREFEAQSSPIARIMTAGLRKATRPVPEIEKAIEDAGEKEAARMRRNCRVLSINASVAPLLGLLGTVLGMIRAFMTVAAREEALGQTELLAAGIYQALVTTAAGLTIAIPSLVLYYIYVERVDRLVTEIDDLATELVEKLSMGMAQ